MATDDVCILIPTLNEEHAIEGVITGFQNEGYDNILVVDGGSTDQTRDRAKDTGATVIQQTGDGKGNAIKEAFDLIKSDYILMADGDGTYSPSDAEKMLKPLRDGDADHVIGNRFPLEGKHSMSQMNQYGNKFINMLFRRVHDANTKDILSGYRAFTRKAVQQMDIGVDGFGIETEIAAECVRNNLKTEIVPIEYNERTHGTDTNLRPVQDGGHILWTLFRLARLSNPFLFFGFPGVTFMLVGAASGVYTGYEWYVHRISHEVIAMFSAFAILLGVQLLMFAALSDLIVTLHRDRQRALETN